MKYQAAIFDMDGLLIDTETVGYQAWKRTAKEMGFPLPDEIYFTFIGIRPEDVKQIFIEKISPDHAFEDVWEAKNKIKKSILANEGVGLMPGVEGVLDLFEAREVPKAVATSSHRPVAEHWLTEKKLADRFKALVTGQEVKLGKPAPDIYLEAANRLGVDPKSCIAFEDAAPGVRAAHAAGMDVVYVPGIAPVKQEVTELASHVLKSLDDFVGLHS